MFDFDEVVATTKDEQIRAWCLEQAIMAGVGAAKVSVVAKEYEQFVKEGKIDGPS